ncbi:MAG: AAA family ATPase [Planctomycetota bacterium]
MAKSAKQKKPKPDIVEMWLERDLTAAAKAGELSRAYGVEDELRRATAVLAAGRNPILAGESGVGKTSILHELVCRAVEGDGPPCLRESQVLEFSVRKCTGYLKQGEPVAEKLRELIVELAGRGSDVVAYFSDFDLGWHYDLESAFESMGHRLANPVIGEGALLTVREMFEWHSRLERDFVVVEVAEPNLSRTRGILEAWAAVRAREIGVKVPDRRVLETALELANRFLAHGRFPSKIIEPMGRLLATSLGTEGLSEADVVDDFCRSYGLPRQLIDHDIPLDIDELSEDFRNKVLGQDEAVDAMVDMVGRIKAGLIDPRRPFGVFLFVGPTGVGKTHLARILADFLGGSADRLIRLNMADYPEERHAATLFGDSEAQAASQKRGLLTLRIVGQPVAVLLLDEFEKSNALVHDRFLQLFDEGSFINGAGQTIPCRSLIIIATSNAGAELWRGGALGFLGSKNSDAMAEELNRKLEEHFRFEFLNRFDRVVQFRQLTREIIRQIALRELELLEQRSGLLQRNLTVEYDEDVVDWLTAHGYDPYYGARFLRRTIEREVSTPLAELIVKSGSARSQSIALEVRGRRLRARWAKLEKRTSKNRETVRTESSPSKSETRKLDRGAVVSESEALLERSAAIREKLKTKQVEYDELLQTMNRDADFWSDRNAARHQLERFRVLDVEIRIERRLAGSFVRLEEKLKLRDDEFELSVLARSLEVASNAMREWRERFAAESGKALWIVISKHDPTISSSEWIVEMARMEISWCRRLELEVELAAYVHAGGELTRLVLEVSGPGAELYLAMEEGIHRRSRSPQRDLRVRVQVLAQGLGPSKAVDVRSHNPRRKFMGHTANCRGSLALKNKGQTLEFLGFDAPTLKQLLADLEISLAEDAGSSDVARAYGEPGRGAHDPRTDASLPRLKDAMKGRLEPLLKAWRQKSE